MARFEVMVLLLALFGVSHILSGCGKEIDHTTGSVCLQTGMLTAPRRLEVRGDDTLSVMVLNTYMISHQVGKVTIKSFPNMAERQLGLANWFNSLSFEEVPDVLVLNEILSDDGEALVRKICSDDFRRRAPFGGFDDDFIECCEGSHFAYTSNVNNARFAHSIFMSGGVVVLVKKGLEMISAEDAQFDSLEGLDVMGSKGYWAVKAKKGEQSYTVIGTHALAYLQYKDNRLKQFAQMRAWVDENVADGERVVFAGDMNINTHNFTTSSGHTHSDLETAGMLNAFGATGAPATGGNLVQQGFWLPLDAELDVSWDAVNNHLVGHQYGPDDEAYEGSQMFDWVLAPGPNDRLATPKDMRQQVVPVLADECYSSEEAPGTFANDLSDHYGIFAQLCYQGPCPQVQEVVGHRGAGQVPSSLNCNKTRRLQDGITFQV